MLLVSVYRPYTLTCSGDDRKRRRNNYYFSITINYIVQTLNDSWVGKVVLQFPQSLSSYLNKSPVYLIAYNMIYYTKSPFNSIRLVLSITRTR